jgi:hypothetical protein
VDDKIRPILESGTAMGSNKPVLMVIDEIDGATGDNVSAAKPAGQRRSDNETGQWFCE